MPGDISRDFADSLSKLHYEVSDLRKSNDQLKTQVEELKKKVDSNQQVNERKQKTRMLQAASSQDPDVIDQLLPHTTSVAELEMLRMFKPLDFTTEVSFEVRPDLLKNFQAEFKGKMPEMIVEEVEEPQHFIATEEYKRQMQNEIAKQAHEALALASARHQAALEKQRRSESNALGQLSPLWFMTDEIV